MGMMGRERSRSRSVQKSPHPAVESDDIEWKIGEDQEMGGLIARKDGSTLNLEAISVSCTDPDWVEKAVVIWKRYRVCVFYEMFSSEVTDTVYRELQHLHSIWSAKYDPGRKGNRMPGRYEMMDAFDSWHLTHIPGYLEALEEFARKGGLKFLEGIGKYKFVGGHAHLCLADTTNVQPLHSDFVHPGPRETKALWEDVDHVAFMDLIMTLHPLTSTNGALRLVPGQPSTDMTYKQFSTAGGRPPPKLIAEPDIFYRSGIFPLPTGCGMLRDLRIWHGGTKNTSEQDRYTSVLRFYSEWSLDMWKNNVYEKPGIDPKVMKEKLSEDTQKCVSPHLVRGEGDAEPKLIPFDGWASAYDGWAHAYDDAPKLSDITPRWSSEYQKDNLFPPEYHNPWPEQTRKRWYDTYATTWESKQ